MTDKEIIINGVDVSECYQYMPRYMEDYDIDTLDYCRYHFKPCKDVDVKYCYYKQFKRKENELEELRQYHNKCCEEFKKEKQDLIDKYNQLSINFYNGDYCNTEHCSLLKSKEKECERLEQTLIQIKEIAEANIRIADLEGLNGIYRRGLAEQILQKISEVLKDE